MTTVSRSTPSIRISRPAGPVAAAAPASAPAVKAPVCEVPRRPSPPSFVDRVLVALHLKKSDAQVRADLKRQVTERLLDNEALRGGKTDDEYEPMLDAALRHLDELVKRTPTPGDQATADEITKVLSAELRPSYTEWKQRTQLAERATDAILDNEALGEDLTDSQYGPILDEGLERLRRAAFSVKNPATEAARDELVRDTSKWIRAQAACVE